MKTLANIIEALLLVSGDAVSVKDIAEKSEVSEKDVLAAAKSLQEKYDGESGVNLLIFNKKLQFCSNPDYADDVSKVLNPIKERELSKSMLEVAAIIAYKQPVTRIDLEELRGSNSEFAIQNLLKIGVIEVVGRKDTVGKPVMFGTTDEFLKRFQISSLDELPDYNTLIDKIAKLRSPANDSTYLFEKDVYDAESEVSLTSDLIVDGENLQTSFNTQTDNGEQAFAQEQQETASDLDSEDDFDLGDIEDEELPDFLEDEEVDVIK